MFAGAVSIPMVCAFGLHLDDVGACVIVSIVLRQGIFIPCASIVL